MHRESLWLRVEALVLRLIEARGETRNSLSQKMGHGRNYLGRYLRTDADRTKDEAIEPAFSVAFEVAEHFGLQATSLFAPFETDAFDRLLGMLVCQDQPDDASLGMLRWCATLDGLLRTGTSDVHSLEERIARMPALGDAYRRLEELERQRHFAAEKTAEECAYRVGALARPALQLTLLQSVEVVGLVSIWGSIQRSRGQLSAAQAVIQQTLRWSKLLSERSLFANQLQRASYVFRDLGAPRLAQTALRFAGELFASDGNRVGEDRTLVDRAVISANRGDLTEAERLYRTALERLTIEGSEHYRACAAAGLSTCLQLRGSLHEAIEFLDRAVQEADPRDSCFKAHLLWTSGSIGCQLRQFEAAEEQYWSAIAIFQDQQRTDWLLAVCIDLALLLMATKRRDRIGSVRELIQEHLPKARNFQDLTGHYEAFLAELIRGPTETKRLEELRGAVQSRSRQADVGPPRLL